MMSRASSERGEGTHDAERLLGCATSELPPFSFADADLAERLELLLEWMVGVARAATGVIVTAEAPDLIDDARADTHLPRPTVRAAVGFEAPPSLDLLRPVDLLEPGLVVHGADLDDSDPGDDQAVAAAHACAGGIVDAAARMTLTMPLTRAAQRYGVIQLGFAELRSLEPTELRRLRMVADHVGRSIDADHLERQKARWQDEVGRVRAVLDDIDRMKGEFLSMMSHELRTPLTAIIGYTDLLLRQIHGPLTERQERHQEAVRRAAHRLLALINDLLDLNRMESGSVSLNLEPLILNEIVQRAVDQLAAGAEQRGVELRLDAPHAPVAVVADADRLLQVVANLLDNAIKFTPEGGTVTLRLDACDGSATVSVVDTGVGVPPEQLERIWDRFHQVDSGTRRQFGGSGLGLAIVRHLVELHTGTVSVASDGAGRGSTFGFTLPLARGLAPADAGPGAGAGEAIRERGQCSILIVDDEPDNREVIASVVQDLMGHQAVLAANGAEALAAARARPDVILLDLRMPGMSGFEVARALRADKDSRRIPIVAITALNDAQDHRAAIEAGCTGWVTKPFSQRELVDAVTTALALVPAARRTG